MFLSNRKSVYINGIILFILIWIASSFMIYFAEKNGHKGQFGYLIKTIDKAKGKDFYAKKYRLLTVMHHVQGELSNEDKNKIAPLLSPYSNLDEYVLILENHLIKSSIRLLEQSKRDDVIEIMERYPIRWTLWECLLSTNWYFITRNALYVPSSLIGRIISDLIIFLNSILILLLLYKLVFFLIRVTNKVFTKFSNRYEIISAFNRFLGHHITQFQLDKLGRLFLILFFLWQMGGLFLWLFERPQSFLYPENSYINNFMESLWSISVYLLSGYEQYIPQSTAGRIISIGIILVGVSIISIFTANIVTIITKRVQERESFPAKPSFVDFSDHIVICGVSDKTDRIIRQLHAGVMRKIDKMRQIVVIGETVNLLKKTEEAVYDQVWTVKGSLLNNDDLSSTNIAHAHAIIILSDDFTVRETVIPEMESFAASKNIKGASDLDKIVDARTILCALAVESVLNKEDKQVHMCIEVRDVQNKDHFAQIQNKEVICSRQFSQRLMVQSTITFGLSHVYAGELLNASTDSTEVYRIPLPKGFVGATYWQLEKCLSENFQTEIYKHRLIKNIEIHLPDVILIGFVTQDNKNGEVQDVICTNPPNPLSLNYHPMKIEKGGQSIVLDKKYRFIQTDEILVIAYIPPDLDQLKNNTKLIENIPIPEKFYGADYSHVEAALAERHFTLIDCPLTKGVEAGDAVSLIGYRHSQYGKLDWDKIELPNALAEQEISLPNLRYDDKTCARTSSCGLGLKNHIVLCNWNNQAPEIIHQLTELEPGRPIVLVLTDTQTLPQDIREKYKNVIVLLGDSSDYHTLKRAEVERAKAVIILSEDTEDELADTISILTALTIENIDPKIHTCVELKRSKNKKHFGRTKVDEIVCVDELTEKLLAQASINPGITQFYLDLLTAEDTSNEIYKIDIPPPFVGKPYCTLKRALFNYHQENIIPIGIEREVGEQTLIQILPRQKANVPDKEAEKITIYDDSILQESDKVFVVAYGKPFDNVNCMA